MPVDLRIIEDDVDEISIEDINNLEVTAMGDLFVKYANTNHPETQEDIFDKPVEDDGTIHPYIGFYVGIELPLPQSIPSLFNWCVRDLTAIEEALNNLLINKQDKLTKVQMDSVNSGATRQKVESYDEHLLNTNNPHQVTKEQLGLGLVVNTGDSDTPEENGVNKFTTGGAYTLKNNLDTKINNEKIARENADTEISNDLIGRIEAEATARENADNNLIRTKQNVLISGSNIKTINGQSIMGSGDLQVSFDPETLDNVLAYDYVDEEGE